MSALSSKLSTSEQDIAVSTVLNLASKRLPGLPIALLFNQNDHFTIIR